MVALRYPAQAQIRRILAAELSVRVLILTADIGAGHDLPAALLADAHGALAAPADPNAESHERDLSKKQVCILQQVTQGRSAKKIGKDIGMSTSAVQAQIGRIVEKLGSDDLVGAGLRAGLIK